ncbi:MAG TPA: RNA-binding S4 domain-containing protein [Candidatus Binatia bacterium]|nr:RNA-binding S4 domain-containing protein [Candidatus Binatia bacterium]
MPTIEFELTREHIELNQLLKLAGLCDSGGAGKRLVAEGKVMVDGKPEARKTAKIRAGQVVVCGEERIVVRAENRC